MYLAVSFFGKHSLCIANRYKINNHHKIEWSAAAKRYCHTANQHTPEISCHYSKVGCVHITLCFVCLWFCSSEKQRGRPGLQVSCSFSAPHPAGSSWSAPSVVWRQVSSFQATFTRERPHWKWKGLSFVSSKYVHVYINIQKLSGRL